ncbi:MAG: FtsX-like permease family protein [Planctomycetota bacterium]|nr:FtsX-like permease family protein [Planctomycetota bacterium]
MYKFLLCWRYLRTRWIALASIVSVTLGVATLIVVNSVMDGFTEEMHNRIHGILSDLVVESHSSSGISDSKWFEDRIRETLGDRLEGLTTVVAVPAMLNFSFNGSNHTQQINLIGIDQQSYASVSDFSQYLMHPENQKRIDFLLKDDGYAPDRTTFPESGWNYRRDMARLRKEIDRETQRNKELRRQIKSAEVGSLSLSDSMDKTTIGGLTASTEATTPATSNPEPPALAANSDSTSTSSPETPQENPTTELASLSDFLSKETTALEPPQSASTTTEMMMAGPSLKMSANDPSARAHYFDSETDTHTGIVIGISIGSMRYRDPHGDVKDLFFVRPGDDVSIALPGAGSPPRAIDESFTVVDFYESKMSEYDSTFAFVPLERLQKIRGMIDPTTGKKSVTSIQMKLKRGVNLAEARDDLRAVFPPDQTMVHVQSWRDTQGPLLAAVQLETTILNILLFMIIAVAGFGILATFFMIVVEKTRDIGVLKSLGAPGSGIASIFLTYGLLLGIVGSGAGVMLGLLFVWNINSIAALIEKITGREVFDPTVYYFSEIPTIIHPTMVVWVIIGSVLIAVMASVLPSIRAARMHPVQALRYE